MGTFNTLLADLVCPRCGELLQAEIEIREGNTSQMQPLKLGDAFPWKNDLRPEDGNLDCEGYLECSLCGKDAIVVVRVRNDRITTVDPNPDKHGYIPD